MYCNVYICSIHKEHLVGDIKVPITERRGINRLNHLEWEADRLLQRNQDVLQNPKNRLVNYIYIYIIFFLLLFLVINIMINEEIRRIYKILNEKIDLE